MTGADRETVGADAWVGRPWAARSVRALVFLLPVAVSIVVAFVLSGMLPRSEGFALGVARWIAIAAVSTIVLMAVDRLARRLLPLATLFSLTLAFPDQAPSRFKLALRSGTTAQLKERVAEARAGRLGDTPAEAAERVLHLVVALGRHDRVTRGHSERVRAYTQMIGEEMGITGVELDRLRWSGLLHDIGKLLVPSAVLNRPGRLTAAEYEMIQRHPLHGRELVAPLIEWLGDAARAVWEHHERWDGEGYPQRLAGTEISLAARIVSVADAYDVMTSARSYQKPVSPVEARAEMMRCSGTQFDPAVVRAFMNLSLGRLRFAMGPLSWLAQVPLFPQAVAATATSGTATAATAIVAAAAASVGVGLSPEPVEPARAAAVAEYALDTSVRPPDTHALPRVANPVVDATATIPPIAGVEPVGGHAARPLPDAEPAAEFPPTSDPADVAPQVSAPASSAPVVTSSVAPEVVPTTVATNVPAVTVPPVIVPPATVPPAVTTTVAAAPVAADELYLAAADIALVVDPPPAVELADYDGDGVPGQAIARNADGLDSDDPTSVPRWSFAPGQPVVISGDVIVPLTVAADGFVAADIHVAVGLYACDASGCAQLAAIDRWVPQASRFKYLNVALGPLDVQLSAAQWLQLRVANLADSEADVELAYGTAEYPSRVSVR